MGPSEEASLELMRQLRTSGQLQHAWIVQAWQHEQGMHPAAVMLLSDLDKHGECRPSELAKRRLVDVSVISRQVAQLASAGLIDRRPAPEDGRAALIRASEKGRQELYRWRAGYVDLMKRALGDWDDEEVTALTARLALMNEALREAVGGTSGNCQTGKRVTK